MKNDTKLSFIEIKNENSFEIKIPCFSLDCMFFDESIDVFLKLQNFCFQFLIPRFQVLRIKGSDAYVILVSFNVYENVLLFLAMDSHPDLCSFSTFASLATLFHSLVTRWFSFWIVSRSSSMAYVITIWKIEILVKKDN